MDICEGVTFNNYLLLLQNTTIEFIDNVADSGGSAIFTNDLNRCQWLNVSNGSRNTYIFNPPEGTISPFNLR